MPFKKNKEINLSNVFLWILLIGYFFYSQNQIKHLKREINELDEIAIKNEGHLIRRIESQDSLFKNITLFIEEQNTLNSSNLELHSKFAKGHELLFESIQLNHPINN